MYNAQVFQKHIFGRMYVCVHVDVDRKQTLRPLFSLSINLTYEIPMHQVPQVIPFQRIKSHDTTIHYPLEEKID